MMARLQVNTHHSMIHISSEAHVLVICDSCVTFLADVSLCFCHLLLMSDSYKRSQIQKEFQKG